MFAFANICFIFHFFCVYNTHCININKVITLSNTTKIHDLARCQCHELKQALVIEIFVWAYLIVYECHVFGERVWLCHTLKQLNIIFLCTILITVSYFNLYRQHKNLCTHFSIQNIERIRKNTMKNDVPPKKWPTISATPSHPVPLYVYFRASSLFLNEMSICAQQLWFMHQQPIIWCKVWFKQAAQVHLA